MLKLENAFLKASNRKLILQTSFNALKRLPSSQSANGDLLNKQLYLAYVEEVLNKKEEDLLELEQYLNLRESELNDVAFHNKIAKQSDSLEKIRKNQRLAEELSLSLGINARYFEELKQRIQEDCLKQRIEMENTLKAEFDNLIHERRLLRDKISQYSELGSYEKYLNQLHDALEQKQQELTSREASLNVQSINSFQSGSSKSKQRSQNSERKRGRIFSKKSHSSPIKFNWNENQTFAYKEYESIPEVNESSEIMEENRNRFLSPKKHQLSAQQTAVQQNVLQQTGVQAQLQTPTEASHRLRMEELKLKFIKNWVKSKMNEKGTNKKIKTLALYQWKLNACFDDQTSTHLMMNLKQLDGNWERKAKVLKQDQLFPYHKLSIQRKNYLEWTFEHQRKVAHRKNLENSLKSIVRNKIRKERLVFYYYFFRFFKNSMTKVDFKKQQNNNSTESRFVKSTSSHILSEERIMAPREKQSVSRKKNLKESEKNIERSEVSKKKQKENTNKKKTDNEANLDIKKLKEYIYEKERTEKLLATQCVKMEGIAKLLFVLTPASFRVLNDTWQTMKEQESEERIEKLYATINSMEFKLDLFITKCRLGIANNSNKLSTLENLLGFTNFIK